MVFALSHGEILCLLVAFRNGPLLVGGFSINGNLVPWRRKPMTTTATHNAHHTTPERVLFVAFELSEKTWKLGFTTGYRQKPRERTVAARHQARLLQADA